MQQKTTGIVLRTVKYGETSIIATLFTEENGVEGFIIKGVRSSKAQGNKAGLLQPANLLDLTIYHYPNRTLQHIKELNAAAIYMNIQQDIYKTTIALFCTEVLLRLLPENAPLPELYQFSFSFFKYLDVAEHGKVANLPLYFIIQCTRQLGYELNGNYSAETPYLNLEEGGFADHATQATAITTGDALLLDKLLAANSIGEAQQIELNGIARNRLTEWYVQFLQAHTQHMGGMRSLPVLHAILHD